MQDEESKVEFLDAILDYAKEDLEIFESVTLLQLLEFKWTAYGGMVNYSSAFVFFIHILCLTYYVYDIYYAGEHGAISHENMPYYLVPGLLFLIFYEFR